MTDTGLEYTATPAPEWLSTSWISGKERRKVKYWSKEPVDVQLGWFIAFTNNNQAVLIETELGNIIVRVIDDVRFATPGEAF
jgi:hypothetical protein